MLQSASATVSGVTVAADYISTAQVALLGRAAAKQPTPSASATGSGVTVAAELISSTAQVSTTVLAGVREATTAGAAAAFSAAHVSARQIVGM